MTCKRLLLCLACCFAVNSLTAKMNVQLQLSGIEDQLLENALANLSLETARQEQKLTSDSIETYYWQGFDQIKDALQPFGYYEATVKGQITHRHGRWLIRYDVTPGRPLIVTKVDMALQGPGQQDLGLRQLFQTPPVLQGQILVQPDYDDFKKSIEIYAKKHGYFAAQFDQANIKIDVAAASAEIILHYTTGPRYQFGAVTFNDVALSEQLLQRYIPFSVGMPYDNHLLQVFNQSLSQNPNFASVEITPQIPKRDSPETIVPITVQLSMRKPLHITTGIGYGTDTGPRTQFDWENRRLNRYGHSFGNSYKISENRDNYQAYYQVLAANPAAGYYKYTASYNADRSPARNSDTHATTFGVIYHHDNPLDNWANDIKLNYREESYRDEHGVTRARLVMPAYDWQWLKADNRFLAQQGTRLTVAIRASHKAFGSNTSFLQTTVSGKHIHTLNTTYRWINRAQLGGTLTHDFSHLPPSLRYYAGGDNSIRGYAYQAIGRKKTNNQHHIYNDGGQYLITVSTELERKLSEKWRTAVFVDSGNAFNHFSDGIKTSSGVGLRWQSPIGLVRLDLAVGLSSDKPWRLHFNLEPDL